MDMNLVGNGVPQLIFLSSRCTSSWVLIKSIATHKALFFIRKMLKSFLFLNENICCGYSLEALRQGTSNEYHNIYFVEK